MLQCARKLLDTADIVIALGKLGKAGTEDEMVELLDEIQRVSVPPGHTLCKEREA
jgi:hypothetical protein